MLCQAPTADEREQVRTRRGVRHSVRSLRLSIVTLNSGSRGSSALCRVVEVRIVLEVLLGASGLLAFATKMLPEVSVPYQFSIKSSN